MAVHQACSRTERCPSGTCSATTTKSSTGATSNSDAADNEPCGADAESGGASQVGEGEAEEEGAGEKEEGGSGGFQWFLICSPTRLQHFLFTAKPNRHEQTIRYDGSLWREHHLKQKCLCQQDSDHSHLVRLHVWPACFLPIKRKSRDYRPSLCLWWTGNNLGPISGFCLNILPYVCLHVCECYYICAHMYYIYPHSWEYSNKTQLTPQ